MKAVAYTILVGVSFLTQCLAQESEHCVLEQQKTFKEGYQDRLDRCEGLYRVRVSGTPLAVLGLAQPLGDVQWNRTRRIDLYWQAPPSTAVHVRALSLKQSVAHRMDSLRSPSIGAKFQWPTDILERVGLSSRDLALATWYKRANFGEASSVYLPVVVAWQPATAPFEVVLYPAVDLNDCAVSLRIEGNATAIWSDRLLSKHGYLATNAIRVQLPPKLKPGLYRFEAAAHMSSGGSTTASAVFQMR